MGPSLLAMYAYKEPGDAVRRTNWLMFIPTNINPIVAITYIYQVPFPALANTRAKFTVGVAVGATLATD